MKKVIIICLMLAAINKVSAQEPMSHGKWEENTHSKNKTAAVQEPNEFSEVEIAVANKMITFSGLPEKKNNALAVVTDASGDAVLQKYISPDNNYIDLRRLSKGEMYFVTLMYKNKSRKGFVVHL